MSVGGPRFRAVFADAVWREDMRRYRASPGAQRIAVAARRRQRPAAWGCPACMMHAALARAYGRLTAADGLFVALAEALGEPLATKDAALVSEAGRHAAVEVIELGRGRRPRARR